MRLARKLVLLATMAMAAMALAAPSAFAQSEPLAHHAVPDIQVRAEPAGTLCPAVTINATRTVAAGGCIVHGSGPNIVLVAHVFGVESVQSTCNVEFDLRIDADGEGFLTHQELTQGTQGVCTRRPCGSLPAGTEGRPWEVSGRETGTVAPREILTALFCVETLNSDGTHSSPTHCEVDVPMTEPTNHRYTFTTPGAPTGGGAEGHGPAGFRCEVSGVFSTEATQPSPTGEGGTRTQVEVNHL
jgi:hypothetical protein